MLNIILCSMKTKVKCVYLLSRKKFNLKKVHMSYKRKVLTHSVTHIAQQSISHRKLKLCSFSVWFRQEIRNGCSNFPLGSTVELVHHNNIKIRKLNDCLTLIVSMKFLIMYC